MVERTPLWSETRRGCDGYEHEPFFFGTTSTSCRVPTERRRRKSKTQSDLFHHILIRARTRAERARSHARPGAPPPPLPGDVVRGKAQTAPTARPDAVPASARSPPSPAARPRRNLHEQLQLASSAARTSACASASMFSTMNERLSPEARWWSATNVSTTLSTAMRFRMESSHSALSRASRAAPRR